AGTGTGTPATGGSCERSSTCTLAWVPPHSAPQFTTYAVLSSPLKNAVTGRSNPATSVIVGFPVPNETTLTEFELSLKTSSRLPLLPIDRKRAEGISNSARKVPVLRLNSSTTPGDCPTTGAVGMAMYAFWLSFETTKLSVNPGRMTEPAAVSPELPMTV